MNFNRSKDKSSSAWINAELDSCTNKLLSESAAKSSRSKRKELLLRLADHLKRYESITVLGQVTPHKSGASS